MSDKDMARPADRAGGPSDLSRCASQPDGAHPSRDDMIDVGERQVLRFHPTHKPIKDGIPRCVMCGQIDEPEYHSAAYCPGAGGWLPFPTSSVKIKLKADSGYRAEIDARITLEQWVLIDRIISTPDQLAQTIVDQDGRVIGTAYTTVKDMLKVEAYQDEHGVAWVPPTAWAYFAACRALRARDSDGSGEAGETGTGSTEGDSAGPQGIAQGEGA